MISHAPFPDSLSAKAPASFNCHVNCSAPVGRKTPRTRCAPRCPRTGRRRAPRAASVRCRPRRAAVVARTPPGRRRGRRGRCRRWRRALRRGSSGAWG
eukprot:5704876-Prymnesium_polylepis.1